MREQARHVLIVFLLGAGLALIPVDGVAQVQSRPPDPMRFLKWPLQDAQAMVESLRIEQAMTAIGYSGFMLLVAQYDEPLTSRAAQIPRNRVVRIVEEVGNVRAIRPAALAIFAGTLLTDNHRLQDAAFTSFQSVIFANLMTSALKTVFGRARPWQELGAHTFRPFSGNTSFPSGHATTAFAFLTPWVLYAPRSVRPILLGIAAGTAFSRMATNVHWFTDVVTGSAIGFFTGLYLTNRHQSAAPRIRVIPMVGPQRVGVQLRLR